MLKRPLIDNPAEGHTPGSVTDLMLYNLLDNLQLGVRTVAQHTGLTRQRLAALRADPDSVTGLEFEALRVYQDRVMARQVVVE